MADANNDVRLWLCDQLNDGSLAMNHCLESLPLRSLCLGDLKHQGRSETGDLHMQFYLEEEDDYGFAPPGPETWLLFIKWYDRDLEEMTFLGTLALDKLTDWEDLLWHIFNMEELKHVDCDEGFSLEALYLEVEQIHLRQIDPTLSMEEVSDFKDGWVLWLTVVILEWNALRQHSCGQWNWIRGLQSSRLCSRADGNFSANSIRLR